MLTNGPCVPVSQPNALHAAGKTSTEAGRAAFNQRFLDQVDPDGLLPEDERQRRAGHARKAYYTALALKSSVARSKAKQLLADAEAADAKLAEASVEIAGGAR